MLEDARELKYPFLLVFLQVCGLRGTPKYISLADTSSAIPTSSTIRQDHWKAQNTNKNQTTRTASRYVKTKRATNSGVVTPAYSKSQASHGT